MLNVQYAEQIVFKNVLLAEHFPLAFRFFVLA